MTTLYEGYVLSYWLTTGPEGNRTKLSDDIKAKPDFVGGYGDFTGTQPENIEPEPNGDVLHFTHVNAASAAWIDALPDAERLGNWIEELDPMAELPPSQEVIDAT